MPSSANDVLPVRDGNPADIRQFLSNPTRTLILDGALATELEVRGCDLNDPLWSAKVLLDEPALIRDVADAYLAAGARCLITASYQGTPQALQERRGISEAAAMAAVANSVAVARAARDAFLATQPTQGPIFVAGSVGPYGAYLADGSEYRGDYALSTEALQAFHRPRIAALVAAGVDLLALETNPSAVEVRAIVQLLEAEFADTPCWVSFTVRAPSPPSPTAPSNTEDTPAVVTQIADGTPLAEIAAFLDQSPSVVAVGFNCIPLRVASAALRALRPHTRKPLVIYPNSGEVYDPADKTWHADPTLNSEAASPASHARVWLGLGARLLGGCCRTGPKDISELAHRVLQLDAE